MGRLLLYAGVRVTDGCESWESGPEQLDGLQFTREELRVIMTALLVGPAMREYFRSFRTANALLLHLFG